MIYDRLFFDREDDELIYSIFVLSYVEGRRRLTFLLSPICVHFFACRVMRFSSVREQNRSQNGFGCVYFVCTTVVAL